MNWGWKIFILYTGFVVLTLVMVVFTMNQDVFLVADDYYKQEIEYQDQIDKISNAKALSKPLVMNYDSVNRVLEVIYPQEHVDHGLKGQINFFRPSDARLDKRYTLTPDPSGRQTFILKGFNRGRWRVKIDWQSKGVPYYEEKDIDII